jgi:hypothetical protein
MSDGGDVDLGHLYSFNDDTNAGFAGYDDAPLTMLR